MAILLGDVLDSLVTLYEKFGNIPVYVETNTTIEGVQNITHDVGQVRRRGVTVVLETTSLINELKRQDNTHTQELFPVIPTQRNHQPEKMTIPTKEDAEKIERAKQATPRKNSGRHRQTTQPTQPTKTTTS